MPTCPRCGQGFESGTEYISLQLIDGEGRTLEETQVHVRCLPADIRRELGR